ncbi:MAG: sugar phosphate nucleotidyltransferase [Bacteroidota bacterium]
MTEKIYDISITAEASILDALKHMDKVSHKLLLVFDKGKYVGLLSIGDIQRAVINNVNLNSTIRSILQTTDRVVVKTNDTIEYIKRLMLEHRTEFMPVINNAGELVNIYFWEDIFLEEQQQLYKQFNLPIVIMAGGVGKRLRPLTHVLPKPLLPIKEKTMLEEIFDRFAVYGSARFFISVNYKADLIKYYINSLNLDYDITFLEEDKPYGTAGSLSLLKNRISETLFVINCDNLITQDYNEILNYHYKNKNEITIIAVVKNYNIAYGTIESENNGRLTTMVEKPEISFKINSGMYILEPHIINEIPDNTEYNMTDLIYKLKKQKRNVGVFPIWKSSWIDIGDWNEYLNLLRTCQE